MSSRYNKKARVWFLQSAFFISVLWVIFLTPTYTKLNTKGSNSYIVKLNGTQVGTVADKQDAYDALRQARRDLASGSDELVLAQSKLTLAGDDDMFGTVDSTDTVSANMLGVLNQSIRSTLKRSYSIKINEYSVNLDSIDAVKELLQSSIAKYDTENNYDADLVLDPDREVNVLTTAVKSKKQVEKVEAAEKENELLPKSGFYTTVEDVFQEIEPLTTSLAFEDFELGLQSLDFNDKVEIVECYLPESEITDVATAVDDVTKDKETNQIYEVQSGDTLGAIAAKYGLSVDALVAMNDSLETENSTIRPEDEIIVTVPEPELSVIYTFQEYYEEDYEAEVQIVENDEWYTTKSVVLQEPSAGHRKVVSLTTYINNDPQQKDIQKEEIVYAAVPKIVERGTIVPPTYIKPISGGRQSSGFGPRKAPKRGASTYHKGIDWATPVGTSVYASSGGTVTKAGWGSGYGYVVYIQHPDGKETRYGHLSKILVKSGQHVSQGDKIALSGNTGVSTGAHLHFEIRIGGTAVNPLTYLN